MPCLRSKIAGALHRKTSTTRLDAVSALGFDERRGEPLVAGASRTEQITEANTLFSINPAGVGFGAEKSARKCEISGVFWLLNVKVSYISGNCHACYLGRSEIS
jgi:hypothetical protein